MISTRPNHAGLLLAILAGLALAAVPALAPALASGVEDGGQACCDHKLEALLGMQATGTPGFDDATGQDLRNFQKDRIVDFQHMRLDLFIPDMETPRASVTQTLRFAPISETIASLSLDAGAMKISGVSALGYEVSFIYDGATLTANFVPSIPPGQTVELVTTYELNDPPRGLIWTLPDRSWPGREPQIHTQGQPQTNHYWFPSHDFPNERLTTEVLATVPAGFLASSNGYLAEKARVVREAPGARTAAGALGPALLRPFDRFHWVQDREHASYLVTLVVGKFDVVDVGGELPRVVDGKEAKFNLSCPVYVPPGRGPDVQYTYANTLPMIAVFEKLFDEPYPWARYAQLVVHNFEAGGMENTSATTMYDTALHTKDSTKDHDLDGLIAHELAHQWFGDLITCNSWEHIWLNEGFATYSEALWFEARDGEPGYQREVLSDYDRVLAADSGVAPLAQGFVSKVWTHPWETFRRAANPYPKGAMTLHMLRTRLGDDVFFRGIQRYIDQHKDSTVETSEFRRVMEDVSGQQLEQFFRQWTQRPGVPRINVKFAYDPARRKLRFDVEQAQQIDDANPAFEFPLGVYIKNSSGPDVVIDPVIASRTDSFEVDLEGPPEFVAVNPQLSTLGAFEVAQSPEQWIAQTQNGPTLVAKIQAIRTLSKQTDAAGNEPLRRISADASAPAFLRVEAIRALASRNARNDISSLVTTSRDIWEVREALCTALGDIASREDAANDLSLRALAERTLLNRAAKDESLRVRNASLRSLAKMRVGEGLELVKAALGSSSQSDGARQAALECLVDYMPKEAMDYASFYAGPGFDNRTRAVAMDVLVRLAQANNDPKDKDRALARLSDMLSIRENRARMSAAEALVKLGDARAIEPLLAAASKARAPELAARLEGFANELRKR
jgi:aminopeptidase N